VAAAFFSANYIAHDSWRPPYSHRADGPLVGALDASLAQQLADGKLPQRLRERLEGIGVRVSLAATVTTRQPGRRWELQDPESEDRWAIVHSGERLLVHVWDDWYDYDGSYWRPENRKGVDRGEPRWEVYALHALVGHHGLLSLTPIWLLSAAGAGILLLRRGEPLRPMALLTASLTAVCLTFYLTRPLEDRNYGGVSCCFRWMFWFTPLWLLCLLPAADAMSRNRWRRCVGLALLLVSIISANYAAANPWSPPWIYDYLEYLGWLHY
jgi:hypothetical protein